MKLRMATRKSRLALAQARWVVERMREHAPDLEVEEVHVSTKGDRIQDRPLASVGGKGLFIAEVEATLADGEADFAVHSLKDVPGDVGLAEGMDIVCVPEREDPRDVLITPDGDELDGLVAGSKVGTSSLRRVCQLKERRPDLQFATLRGNVDTRLRKLHEGQFAAIVLAAAGLRRLDLLEGLAHWPIPPDTCIPSVGQGTLAIEGRADDERLRELLAPLEHEPTRLRTEAERAMLIALQGSCNVPIAGFSRLLDDGKRMSLDGVVGSEEGDQMLRSAGERYLGGRDHAARIEEARTLGREVAEGLISRGARELMQQAEASLARRAQHSN